MDDDLNLPDLDLSLPETETVDLPALAPEAEQGLPVTSTETLPEISSDENVTGSHFPELPETEVDHFSTLEEPEESGGDSSDPHFSALEEPDDDPADPLSPPTDPSTDTPPEPAFSGISTADDDFPSRMTYESPLDPPTESTANARSVSSDDDELPHLQEADDLSLEEGATDLTDVLDSLERIASGVNKLSPKETFPSHSHELLRIDSLLRNR